jgi:hypothetical protein
MAPFKTTFCFLEVVLVMVAATAVDVQGMAVADDQEALRAVGLNTAFLPLF